MGPGKKTAGRPAAHNPWWVCRCALASEAPQRRQTTASADTRPAAMISPEDMQGLSPRICGSVRGQCAGSVPVRPPVQCRACPHPAVPTRRVRLCGVCPRLAACAGSVPARRSLHGGKKMFVFMGGFLVSIRLFTVCRVTVAVASRPFLFPVTTAGSRHTRRRWAEMCP